MRYCLIALCLIVSPAWADIVARYAIKDGGDMTLSYRDANHVRLQVAEDSFMLLADGKVWMVNRDGKAWTAMDMSEMGKMMQGFKMPGMGKESAGQSAGNDVTFKKTGRTETIAGYTGNVYEVNDKSAGERWEVVLTDHDDVTAASKAFVAFSGAMASGMGMTGFNPAQVMDTIASHVETGLLRQDDNMRLTAIDTGKQADSVFALPPGTKIQKMPSMPAMPQGMPGMPKGFSFPQ